LSKLYKENQKLPICELVAAAADTAVVRLVTVDTANVEYVILSTQFMIAGVVVEPPANRPKVLLPVAAGFVLLLKLVDAFAVAFDE
jgi:hypothetical protein